MITAVQKIIVQGTSAAIVLPRRLILKWGLNPGEFLRIDLDESTGVAVVRPWAVENASRSPGIIATSPTLPAK